MDYLDFLNQTKLALKMVKGDDTFEYHLSSQTEDSVQFFWKKLKEGIKVYMAY